MIDSYPGLARKIAAGSKTGQPCASGVAVLVILLLIAGMFQISCRPDRVEPSSWQEAVALDLDELREIAEQGSAETQLWLGYRYLEGKGAPQDDPEAVRWFQKAAGRGHPRAQFELASKYRVGQGIAKDETEAIRWYRRAAEQGHPGAQFEIGMAYLRGTDVAQNDLLAHMWLSLATAGQNPEAARSLAELAERLTPARVEEAQRMADEWRDKHSND